MAGQSTGVVLAALVANGAIAVLKFGAYLLTGSPAMLSEVYHSISDTGNQVFLLVGIFYGARERDRRHPFGYGKAQFFFSFLVSVMLFGIAGWESLTHGYHEVTTAGAAEIGRTLTVQGATFPRVWVSYAVLGGAVVFESYAFVKAYRAMAAEIDEREWSGFREAFRKTSNTTTLTALTEDTIALLGLLAALAGIAATQLTGREIYDAASAMLIGVMLMGFAVALAWENKRLLMGESMPASEEAELERIVEEWDGVDAVVGFRTVYFGPDDVLVTADVAFVDGIDTATMDDAITDIEDAIKEHNPAVTKVYVEPEDVDRPAPGPDGDPGSAVDPAPGGN
jgi:cation diffusion facilitator family transporter